jgi:hypothetical protein
MQKGGIKSGTKSGANEDRLAAKIDAAINRAE